MSLWRLYGLLTIIQYHVHYDDIDRWGEFSANLIGFVRVWLFVGDRRAYDVYSKHLRCDLSCGLRGMLVKMVAEDPYGSDATTLSDPGEEYQEQLNWVDDLIQEVREATQIDVLASTKYLFSCKLIDWPLQIVLIFSFLLLLLPHAIVYRAHTFL